MSKTKIFIAVIAILAVGTVAVVLISFRPVMISPEVSERAGEEAQQTPEVETPEATPISESEAVSDGVDAQIEGELSLDKVEGPGTQEFEGINYRIVYKTESEGLPVVFDVLTEKINKQKADSLAKKIINDITSADPNIKMMTIKFYSKISLIDEQKIDIATIDWTPDNTSLKMIAE